MIPNRTLVLFLIILYIQFQGLEGRGELTIRLVSFDNDYGLTYDGGCCDNWQARGWGCMQKCDYVMRVVISGLSRANDHVFLFHRPLMYNKNNIIFDDCPWATELSIPFDTWPGQVELSAYFYDYDDNDDTTLLVDWFDTRLRQDSISTKFRHMAVIGSRRNYKTRLTFDWAVSCAGLSNCIRDDVKHFLDRVDHHDYHSKDPITSAAASSGEDPPKSMSTKNTESTTTGEEVQIMTNKTLPTRTAPTNGIWGRKRTTSAAVTGRPITVGLGARPTVTGVTRLTESPQSLKTRASEATGTTTTTATPVTSVPASIKTNREITRQPFHRSSSKVTDKKSSLHIPTTATTSTAKSGSAEVNTKTTEKATIIEQQPMVTQEFFPSAPLSTQINTTPVSMNLTAADDNSPSATGSSMKPKLSTTKSPYRGRKNKNPFNGHPPLPIFKGAGRDIIPDLDEPRDHLPTFSRNPDIRPPPKRRKYPARGTPGLTGREKNFRPKPQQHGRLSKIEQFETGNVSQPSPSVPKKQNSKNLSQWHGYHQIPGVTPHLRDGRKENTNSSLNETSDGIFPPSKTEHSQSSKPEEEQNLAITTPADSNLDLISHSYYDQSLKKGFQSVSAMRRIPTTKSRHDEARPMTEPPHETFPIMNNVSMDSGKKLHVPSPKPSVRTAESKSRGHTRQSGGERRNPFTPQSPERKHFYITSGTKRLTPLPNKDDRPAFKTASPKTQPTTIAVPLSHSEPSTKETDVTFSSKPDVHSKNQVSNGKDTPVPPKMRSTQKQSPGEMTRNSGPHAKDSSRWHPTTNSLLSSLASTAATMTVWYPSSNDFTNTGEETRVTFQDTNDMTDSFHTFNYVSSEGDSKKTLDIGYEQFFTESGLKTEPKHHRSNGHDGIFSSAATRKPDFEGETRHLPGSRNTIGWFRKSTKRVHPLQTIDESSSLSTSRKSAQLPGHFFISTTKPPGQLSTKRQSLKPWYRAKDTDHLYDNMKTIRHSRTKTTQEMSTPPFSTAPDTITSITEIPGKIPPATREIVRESSRDGLPKFRERFIPKRTTTDGTRVSPSHITTMGPLHKTRRTGKPPPISAAKPTSPWLRKGTRRRRPTFPHVPTRAPSPQLKPKDSDEHSKVPVGRTNEPSVDSTTSLFTRHQVATTVNPTVASRETTGFLTTETTISSTRRSIFPKFSREHNDRKNTVQSDYYSKGSRNKLTTLPHSHPVSEIVRTSPSTKDKKYSPKYPSVTPKYLRTTTSRSTVTPSFQLTTKRSTTNRYTRRIHMQRTTSHTRPTTQTSSATRTISITSRETTTDLPKTWPDSVILDNDRPRQTGRKGSTVREGENDNILRNERVKPTKFSTTRLKSPYVTPKVIHRGDTRSNSKVTIHSKNEISSNKFDKSMSTPWEVSESNPVVETVTSWRWNTPVLNPKKSIATKTEMYGSSRFPKLKTPRWRNIKRINVKPKSSGISRKPTTPSSRTMSTRGFRASTESPLVTVESDTDDTIVATTTKYTSLNLIDDESLDAIENWWKQFAPDAHSSREATLPPWTRNTWKRFQPKREETTITTETSAPQESIASSVATKKSTQTTIFPSTRGKTRTQTIITRRTVKPTPLATTDGQAILTEVPIQGGIELNVITTFPPWKENSKTRGRGKFRVKSAPTTTRASRASSTRRSLSATTKVPRRQPTRKTNARRTGFTTTEFLTTTGKIRSTSPPWTRNTWKRFKPISTQRSSTTKPTSRHPVDEEFSHSTTWPSRTTTGTKTNWSKGKNSLHTTTQESHTRVEDTQSRTTIHIPTKENIFGDLKLDPVDHNDYETKSTLDPKEMDDYFETSLFPTSKRTYRDFSSEDGEGLDSSMYPALASNTKPPETDFSMEGMPDSQKPNNNWFTAIQPSVDKTSNETAGSTSVTRGIKNDVEWNGELLDLLATSGKRYFKTSKIPETSTVSKSDDTKDDSLKGNMKDVRRISSAKNDQPTAEISRSTTTTSTTVQDESTRTDLPHMTGVPNSTKLVTDQDPSTPGLSDDKVLLSTLITPSTVKFTTLTDRHPVSSSSTKLSSSATPKEKTSGTSPTPVTKVSKTKPSPTTSVRTRTVLPASVSPITTVLHTSPTPIIPTVPETSSSKASLQTSSTPPKPSSTLHPASNSSVVKNDSILNFTATPSPNITAANPSTSSTMSSTSTSPVLEKSNNGTVNIISAKQIPVKNSSISNTAMQSTLRVPYSTRDPNSIKVTLPDLISLHNGTTSSVRNGGKPDFVLNANPVKKKRPPITINAVAAGGRPTTTVKPTDPPTPPPTPKWREILPDLITLVSVKIPIQTTPRAVGRKTISSSKPVSPASPVYQNADHNKRTKSLDFKTVVEKYWPAILGSFIGAVFLTAAILTSVLCKQQRIFLRRSRSRPQLRRSPASEQASSEQPEMTESSSSASLCGDH